MGEKWVWLPLGLFLFLYGLFAVTTIGVVWGREILGFSALVAGVACLLCGFRLYRGNP